MTDQMTTLEVQFSKGEYSDESEKDKKSSEDQTLNLTTSGADAV